MPRSIFGWSLPPGCTHKMIDDLFDEGPCECCGRMIDDCFCEECPICHEFGNWNCYVNHGMVFSKRQREGQRELEDQLEQMKVQDDAMYEEWVKDGEWADDPARSRVSKSEVDEAIDKILKP